MQVRVFTLAFSSALNGFDDAELRDFVKDREVLSVRDHFFVKDEAPFLAVVATFNLLRPEQEIQGLQEKKKREDREAWRELLEEAGWPLFNTLRDWRGLRVN